MSHDEEEHITNNNEETYGITTILTINHMDSSLEFNTSDPLKNATYSNRSFVFFLFSGIPMFPTEPINEMKVKQEKVSPC